MMVGMQGISGCPMYEALWLVDLKLYIHKELMVNSLFPYNQVNSWIVVIGPKLNQLEIVFHWGKKSFHSRPGKTRFLWQLRGLQQWASSGLWPHGGKPSGFRVWSNSSRLVIPKPGSVYSNRHMSNLWTPYRCLRNNRLMRSWLQPSQNLISL